MSEKEEFTLADAKEQWLVDIIENNTAMELAEKLWSKMTEQEKLKELLEIQKIYSGE